MPVAGEIWDVRAPTGFLPCLAGGSCPVGRGCKAELPDAWLVSLGCSCLPQDREQPAMGSPRITDSPLPTPLFHGRTQGAGIWVSAVTHGQRICGFAQLQAACSGQEQQYCSYATKNARAGDSPFLLGLSGQHGWDHCSVMLQPTSVQSQTDYIESTLKNKTCVS